MNITGTVEAVTSKPVNTKFGPKPTFTIKVDGDWFKCGFTKPKCNTGDEVTFDYTEGTYGKEIDMKAFSVAGGAKPVVASVPKSEAPRPTFGGKGVFPIPPLDGQRAIVRQNSLTNAVNLLKDSMDKKMSDSDKASQIILIARMFEAYSCGDLDLAKAVAMKTPAAKEAKVEDIGNPFEEAAA